MWRSMKCTKLPSLNKAIDGDEGGNGSVNSRAFATASDSCPAKTVNNSVGFLLPLVTASITPGLQVPAAQPQTELNTTN